MTTSEPHQTNHLLRPDTELPSLLPHTDTDSGKSSVTELVSTSCRVLSWSCSPDTGRAGEMLGEMMRRELPTCTRSDLRHESVS